MADELLTYRTRGIHYFPGCVRCPLAGVGARGEFDSNRLVTDDADTEVTVDLQRRRITIKNARTYAEKTVIADLMFLADGNATNGEVTPIGLHLKVFKRGHKITTDFHRHLRTWGQGPFTSAVFERFEVFVDDQRVFAPEDADRTICHPPFALRIVKALMATKDRKDLPPGRIVDLSVGFNIGVEYMVCRATLSSLDDRNDALLAGGELPRILGEGAWEMRLTALTEKGYLPEVVKRDLFLFGLDEVPVLARVRERGLAQGETMWFRFEPGRGTVGVDERSADLPGAVDVARAYLEFHMLGGLLAERVLRRAPS
jgi:hypothetical protein